MNAIETSDTYEEPAAPDRYDDELPSRGLLSFYDRLRERVLAAVERRGSRLGERTVEALLLVPDVFILLARLALDREVPKSTRLMVASTLAYFVVPVDFLPEAVLGAGGFVDDLVLAVAVLSQAFGRELEPYAERYWSGSRKLREVLGDVLEAAHALVGYDVYERLKGYLAKKGVDLDAAAADERS
ncbi:MAG TPA: DUF1232 domain-containing protein [Thermoanaerobaculia bacterium]|jgi:uncharacterized membrane protein YkvA (DUF1232 family)